MTETYSLGATGQLADSLLAVSTFKVGDTAGLAGSQANAMMTGAPIVCKGPDGALGNFVIDADRSRPGGPIVLKPM